MRARDPATGTARRYLECAPYCHSRSTLFHLHNYIACSICSPIYTEQFSPDYIVQLGARGFDLACLGFAMAEAIGIASGILGLTTFALQSGKLLYESFERFKNQPRSVRELKEELDAFTAVLNSLRDTVTDSDINLDILETPLLRSGQACKEFALIVAKCASRSGKDDRSFRGWVTLTYREKDIGGFRSLIAAYKSTIAIALADSNMLVAPCSYNMSLWLTCLDGSSRSPPVCSENTRE